LSLIKKKIFSPRSVVDPSKQGPSPVFGPWSQAVEAGPFVFISGQVPVDRDGNTVGRGDIVKQTRKVLENMRLLLEEMGLNMNHVAAINVYVTDVEAFYKQGASDVRREFWTEGEYPKSTVVEVKRLANPEWMVEIEAIAIKESHC